MLVRLMSDLHLEFGRDPDPIIPPMAEDMDSILVLAGDIDMGSQACDVFLPDLSTRFKAVLYVLGNHEFYRQDHGDLANEIRSELEDFPNIHLLDDEAIVIDDVRFVGSTLWTDCGRRNPTSMVLIEQGMSDYSEIRLQGNRLRVTDTIEFHRKAVDFIQGQLEEKHEGPTILITHHLPSFRSVHPMYLGPMHAPLNHGFYSDLDWLMHTYDITYWLHGHTHQTHNYDLFDVKVRMNPLGYGDLDTGLENLRFDPQFRIEV